VTVHAHVRAHYYPDAGTTALPAPIHGEVQAVFEIHFVPPPPLPVVGVMMAPAPGHLGEALIGSGGKLVVRPSSDDSKIRFIAAPGGGLSAVEESRIGAEIRKVLRHSIELLPVDLPPGFPFQALKGVGSGAQQALALPLQLTPGASPPAGGIQGITQPITGSSGFAFGVSKEFVKAVFKPTTDALRQIQGNITVSIENWFDPTYHYAVTNVELQFNNGTIDLVIKAKATTGAWYAPNYENIVITQKLALVLFLGTLFVRDAGLTVTGAGRGTSAIRSIVISTRNQILPDAEASMNTQLQEAMTRFNTALHSFDPAVSVKLKAGHSEESGAAANGAVAVTLDGVIVRGDIVGGARSAPIIDIADTHQGAAFTAFKSWIPGGRITRFVWSWVEHGSTPIEVALGGVEKSSADEHNFIFPKPPGISDLSRICLRIEGTQTMPDGSEVAIAGGTTCEVSAPAFELDLPPWWAPMALPVWTPDLADDVVMRDAVAGHVAVQTAGAGRGEPGTAGLVYFPDWRSARPLEALGAALTQARVASPLEVVVVLPAGAFDQRKRDIEAKLAAERFPARLHLTEDDESGWSRTFGVTKTPSVFLINARREFVWKHEGDPAPAVLAAALYKHLAPVPARRPRRLRLAVKAGSRAPEVMFQDDRGNGGALHRLRGRHVLLNFWQAWSAPCLAELRRLQGVHEAGKGSPVVIAFHGGADGKTLSEVRKRLGTSFAFVQDSEQRVARLYGVRCWPTTIAVNPAGDVEHVQMGVAHEHGRAKGV
jgi:peroxiredoxin